MDSNNALDAMVLADRNGATIAQRSSSGLALTSIEKLRDHEQSAPSGTHADTPSIIDRTRGTTNLAVVTIGAADYMLYVQPVQLSMMHEGKDHAQTPEEWTLCGLVRLDRFRASSSTIPTTYWLFSGAVLALICLAIPLLKLRVLSARERLRRIDGVLVSGPAQAAKPDVLPCAGHRNSRNFKMIWWEENGRRFDWARLSPRSRRHR